MEKKIIRTIEELKEISSEYHYEYFDAETGILELDFPYDEEEKWGHFDYRVEYQLSGEALAFAQEEERQYMEGDEEEEDIFGKDYNFNEEEDVTEEDVTEESESLHLPCGGVFKGDFYAPKKNQIRAANREWRRRKSTGRFSDDGSRWN